MTGLKQILFMTLVVTIATVVEGQKKYTDANRPYEFGFKIDGEQHRHEKKDEGGLIMGEFGFITGDGIYHVTVFATDENGNYKILSMKHVRVGPSPWGPAKQKTPAITTTTPRPPPPALQGPTSRPKLDGKPGCSGCLIPTPPPARPPGGRPQGALNSPGSGQSGQFPGSGVSGQFPGSGAAGQFPGSGGFGQFPGSGGAGKPGQYPGSGVSGQFPGSGGSGQFPGSGGSGQFPGSGGSGQFPGPGGSGQFPGSGGSGQFPGSGGSGQFPGSGGSGQFPGSGGGKFPGSGSSGQFPGPGGSGKPGQFPGTSGVPATGSVGSGTPGIFPGVQGPGSGVNTQGGPNKVQPGLPPGMSLDDVMGLLYKFNYTVGFHGHNELGYKNGDKEGEYFTNSRDGLSRIVTYVANENGFQPKVKFVRLSKEDTPRAETEKEYGLKGYEFKWFNKR